MRSESEREKERRRREVGRLILKPPCLAVVKLLSGALRITRPTFCSMVFIGR
jgi:hypothetical protein